MQELSIGRTTFYRTMRTMQVRGWFVNPGKSYVITPDGREVLEEHRQGIIEWIEYAVLGRGDMASLLRWKRAIPARKGLSPQLVERLQGSDDPEFWEALVDVALKINVDRHRPCGQLIII